MVTVRPYIRRLFRRPKPIALQDWGTLRLLVTPTLLFALAYGVLHLQTDFVKANAYSAPAVALAGLTSAPVWEESLKVSIGLLVGAVTLLVLSVVEKALVRSGRIIRDPTVTRVRIGFVASLVGFLAVAIFVFALPEIAGGTFSGQTDGPRDAVLKLLGHPAFSMLVLPVALEARARTALFVALGMGFHSLLNATVGLTAGLDDLLQLGIVATLVLLIWVLNLTQLARWLGKGSETL